MDTHKHQSLRFLRKNKTASKNRTGFDGKGKKAAGDRQWVVKACNGVHLEMEIQ